LKDLSYL